MRARARASVCVRERQGREAGRETFVNTADILFICCTEPSLHDRHTWISPELSYPKEEKQLLPSSVKLF